MDFEGLLKLPNGEDTAAADLVGPDADKGPGGHAAASRQREVYIVMDAGQDGGAQHHQVPIHH